MADERDGFSARRERELNDYLRDRFLGGKGSVRMMTAGDLEETDRDGGDGLAAVLCTGPHDQVAAVRARADDLFGAAVVSSLTFSADRHRASFHVADERRDLVQALCRWVADEAAAGRLRDVQVRVVPLTG